MRFDLQLAFLDANDCMLSTIYSMTQSYGNVKESIHFKWALPLKYKSSKLKHDWIPLNIQGATQSQKPKSKNLLFFWKERVCYFAHPVEALFETDEDPGISRWPALVLKVCSLDLHGNEVCEGYTWISLHDLCPGNKDTLLKTWKPQSTKTVLFLTHWTLLLVSLFQQFKQIVNGGRSEVKSIDSVGIPVNPGAALSKYGIHTTSSGSIQVWKPLHDFLESCGICWRADQNQLRFTAISWRHTNTSPDSGNRED